MRMQRNENPAMELESGKRNEKMTGGMRIRQGEWESGKENENKAGG